MLQVKINEKSIGSKVLMKNFEFRLSSNEKLGLIGRNGTGKTTLFRILTGLDQDYDGEVLVSNSVSVMSTAQEHNVGETVSTIGYITSRMPKFEELLNIIETYPDTMGENLRKQTIYSDALTEFSEKGYYDVQNSIEKLFDSYQLDRELIHRAFMSLSGGQKRLVELIAIQLVDPSIALLDEPTNHMDYIAKDVFINWLRNTKSSVIVISHDRDVLQQVDRIIELKDRKAHNYPGDYDDYLAQNAIKTVNQTQGFETTEKRISRIKEQIEYARAKAPGYKGKAGKNPWVVMRERLERELEEINKSHEKPSFWIDRESSENLRPQMVDSYHKFKAKNIQLHKTETSQDGLLFVISNLCLGYTDVPLFSPISFQLRTGERLHIKGRNGAGKTTLVKAIITAVNGKKPETLIGKGIIEPSKSIRLSLYEQEITSNILDKSLYEAIEQVYRDKNLPVNNQSIRRDMSNYLFDPIADAGIKLEQLSGGQKARLQLIRLLVGSPNLLILDEPTNHLDLPSIEELENTLRMFTGAILYISHDSYFAKNIGGNEVTLK